MEIIIRGEESLYCYLFTQQFLQKISNIQQKHKFHKPKVFFLIM